MLLSVRALALAAMLFSAGCGGSGGTNVPPAPVPTPTRSPIPVTTQAYEAQTTLTGLQALVAISLFAGPGNIANIPFGGATVYPSCLPGVPPFDSFEYGYQSPAPPPVRPVPSSQIVLSTFYDTACTQPKSIYTLVFLQNSLTNVSFTGTQVKYALGGAIANYTTLAGSQIVSGGTTTFNLTGSVAAAAPPSPQTGRYGMTCLYSTASGEGCGFGGVQNSTPLNAEIGVAMNFNGLQPPPGSSSGSVSALGYTGAQNALTVSAGVPPAWLIGGGSLVANDSGTYAFNVNKNGQLSGFTMQLTDPPNDAAPSLVQDTSFTLFDGVVMQISTGVNVAHYLVDNNGNGSMFYSNGVLQSITNFCLGC